MLIHPKMVAIDLIGPMTVFNIMRFNVQLVWKDKTSVTTELGIPIQATQTFEIGSTSRSIMSLSTLGE